jgi:hypothetical protein
LFSQPFGGLGGILLHEIQQLSVEAIQVHAESCRKKARSRLQSRPLRGLPP